MESNNQPKTIVAGKIYVASGRRKEFIDRSLEAIAQARETGECIDFAVSADPVDSERVNIFELWETKKALQEFRGEGPGEDLSQLIEKAEVAEYSV